MAEKGKLLRPKDFKAYCPPKHKITDCYPLVTGDSCGAKNISFFLVDIHPGGEAEEAVHVNSEHGYFIVSGKGKAKVEGEEYNVEPGDCLYIPKGAKHEIKPVGDQTLRFAVFNAPPR